MAGWIGFAGIVMLVIGFIDFFQGLIALFKGDYYVVTSSDSRDQPPGQGLGDDHLGRAARPRGLRAAQRASWARWFTISSWA
jgi:hypothetical protein